MPLAAILGVCLLLPRLQASIVLPTTAVLQSASSKENQPNSQSRSNANPDCKPATPTKTKKHPTTHKSQAPASKQTGTTPATTVIKNGGTDEPTVDLSPEVNQKQASEQTVRTNQLLANSDANLKKISGRQLSASQQDTVKQIQSYMDQS